ncbi:MAG TPA: Gfo/Idh/MocA family oxidoreductase [Planctomycetaceae bacterium]|nr:Gfo/Idh/MocA family oxidoreductase [Planctomycetaceae bacterium]
MSRVRMAVIGVGALGRHHARILKSMKRVELVAVVDSQAERGQQEAAKHNTRWVSDHHTLFDQVDAVSIVVPTIAHGDVAGDFLSHGIPVFVEKPLAESVSTAQKLVDLADEHHVALQVGHVERFNPAFEAARPYCLSPKYIRAERFSPFTFRSTDIGVVLDMMVHDIDLILSLVRSPVCEVDAFGVTLMGPHEDTVQARLKFENGCIADLSASRVNPEVRRSMQVWSQHGCVNIDMQQRIVTRTAPAPALRSGPSPVEMSRQPGANIEELKARVFSEFLPTESIPVAPGDALTAELASFANCVRTKLRPHVDGHQALEAIQVAERIIRRVKAHQWDGGPQQRPTQWRAAA